MAETKGRMQETPMPETMEVLTIAPKSRFHKFKARLAVMDVTQHKIATLWGCTPQQLLYWARSDHRDVKGETLERLAEILGVGIEYLTTPTWDGLTNPIPAWLAEQL